MEYIPSLRPLSLLARLRLFWADVLFVWACVQRGVLDHLSDPIRSFTSPDEDARQRTAATEAERAAEHTQQQKREARQPHSPGRPPQLRVLSLNIWGLPISPCVLQRVQELSKCLHLYDLVAFQELSHEREIQWLRVHCASIGLTHFHLFRQGVGFPSWKSVTAPSLALFSRFPIIDVVWHRFTINGKMMKISHSDYMGAKGVGLVRVDVSSLMNGGAGEAESATASSCRPVIGVDVFISHLHANYTNFFYDWRRWCAPLAEHERVRKAGDPPLLPIPSMRDIDDEYVAHRVLQTFELARFIAAHRRPDFLTLLAGDLNSPPYDLCIQLLQSLTFGQSEGCVPRLIDAFAELHPASHGFTCGATDNSFTFSSQPLHMEPRRASGAASTPTSARNVQTEDDAKDSEEENSHEQRRAWSRARFNSSPNSSLIPSDSTLRASRSFGEHPLLLSSTHPSPSADAASGAESSVVTGAASERATGVADAAPSRVRSPYAWVDDHAPKRIDFVFYSNPVRAPICRCQADLMQLPSQQLAVDDPAVQAAAAACTCSAALTQLATPSKLWRVTDASIFKMYMRAEDGRVTSISDHHGVSVCLQLQSRDQSASSAQQASKATSTVIISQLSTTPLGAAAVTPAGESPSSPLLPLHRKKIVRDGVEVGEETDLFTLDDASALDAPVSSSAPVCTPRSGVSSTAGGAVPLLPTSTLLLLASGVMWLGLRDATDRRAAHLTRMAHAFAIFLIGTRSLWIWALEAAFEQVLELYVLPAWMRDLSLPRTVSLSARWLLWCIDWAHAALPIYIVIEWLLTTFPAKEEQSAMRQTIAEMDTLRRYCKDRENRTDKMNRQLMLQSQAEITEST